MKKSEEKNNQPRIHLGEALASPYVIDLRRDKPRVIAVRRIHPVEAMIDDPVLDLRPSRDELSGQYQEQDFTSAESSVPMAPIMPRLIHRVTDVWTFKTVEEKADEAFAMLELPDIDETTPPITQLPNYPITIFHRLRLPPGTSKAIAAFVGLSFLFVLPIQAMQQVGRAKASQEVIATVSARALSNLNLGQADLQDSDYQLAESDFTRASENFGLAQENLDALSGSIQAVLSLAPPTSAAYNSLTALVNVGENLSKSAALFASALSLIDQSSSENPVDKMDILTIYLQRLQPLIAEAADQMAKVDVTALPEEHQDAVRLVMASLPSLRQSIDQFLTFNQTIRLMFGAEQPMRYLLLFQNNAELRPTGGFLGSYAEMTVDNGEIVEMQVPGGGTYDLQGSLDQFVAAPDPLQLINARWEFQDGNWFPDFAASAEKLLWFYDHAGGPTVDGVLAVNATFVAGLIDLLGPIDMADYDRTITGDNFLTETQRIVGIEADKTLNKPKQFLSDLTPKLLVKATQADTLSFLALLQKVGTGLAERDIQLYMKDARMQKTIDVLGWSGRVAQTDGDYLMVVDANIGGGKTDMVIDQKIEVEVVIADDGSIVNAVTISRTHNGVKGDLFTGVNNVDYQRVYVPEGSILLSVDGDVAAPDTSLFEVSTLPLEIDDDLSMITGDIRYDALSRTLINDEFGKTVFGNWVQTKPGSTSTITYTYRLPFVIDGVGYRQGLFSGLKSALGFSNVGRYTMLVQKQSGVLNRRTTVRVVTPERVNTVWSSDDAASQSGAEFDGMADAYVAQLFEVK